MFCPQREQKKGIGSWTTIANSQLMDVTCLIAKQLKIGDMHTLYVLE